MLDTRFPRPPGDIGNPVTFERVGIPARFKTVSGASPKRVVQQADPALLKPFIDAVASLVEDGASMVSTSCGFLAAYQSQLSDAVRVPVITSSLLQCVRFRRPGIVTFDASALGAIGTRRERSHSGGRPGRNTHRGRRTVDRVLPQDSRQRADARRTRGTEECRRFRDPPCQPASRCRRHHLGMHQHAAVSRRSGQRDRPQGS
jgi:hypothetical protein